MCESQICIATLHWALNCCASSSRKESTSTGPTKFEVQIVAQFDNHNSQVWRVSWNITSTLLASSGDDGCVRLWKGQRLLSIAHLSLHLSQPRTERRHATERSSRNAQRSAISFHELTTICNQFGCIFGEMDGHSLKLLTLFCKTAFGHVCANQTKLCTCMQ